MRRFFFPDSRGVVLLLLIAGLAVGCATMKIDWNGRIGSYTYDEAVVELGPPDKSAQLADGATVAEWLAYRSYAHRIGFYGGLGYPYNHCPGYFTYYDPYPTYESFWRLTFDRERRLTAWKKIIR